MITSGNFPDINQCRGYWMSMSAKFNKETVDTKVLEEITVVDNLTQEKARYTSIFGVGRMQVVGETDTVYEDTLIEGYDSTKPMTIFSNGLTISDKAQRDAQDPYNVLKQKAAMFVDSKNDTVNYHGFAKLNTGHTDLAPDGQYVFDTDHPIEDLSGTWSNKTSAELSYSSLQEALIAFQYVKNGRGMYVKQKAGALLVPPALEFEAKNILGASAPGTSDNDMNVIKDQNLKLLVSPYLTSSKICFLFRQNKDREDYPFRFIQHTPYTTDAWEDKNIVGGAKRFSAYMVMAFHIPYVRGIHSLYAV